MRTATVADLRNEFPKVFAWIEAGEEIAITKRGRIVASLAPPKPRKKKKLDWAARLKTRPPVGKGISQEATDNLWSDLRD